MTKHINTKELRPWDLTRRRVPASAREVASFTSKPHIGLVPQLAPDHYVDLAEQNHANVANMVINLLVAHNPKRQYSRDRFAKYKTGQTVAQYVEACKHLHGGKATTCLRDLAYDSNRQYIALLPAGSKALAPVDVAPSPLVATPAASSADVTLGGDSGDSIPIDQRNTQLPKSPADDPLIKEVADHFFAESDYFSAEIKIMANTAMQTVAYANGQLFVDVMKSKDTNLTQKEMEQEIAEVFAKEGYCCALTGYDFHQETKNPHLKPSLDRKNSALGYIKGNLQVVTRAANFYKSASDEADWALKAKAMRKMALAMQQRERSQEPKRG